MQGSVDHLELAGPMGLYGRTIGTGGVHVNNELVVQQGDPFRRNLCPAPEGEVTCAGWYVRIKIRLLLEFSLASAVCVEITIGKHVDMLKAIVVGEGVRPERS
jgi:hypothetical protein